MPETPWSPSGTPSGAATLAPRPAAETARLVQFSCQRLLVIEPRFAAAFHDSVCELTPQMLLTPAQAGRELSAAVAHCLLWAALTRDPAEKVERTVHGFAADHHARGFPDDAYSSIGHALLRSVRAVLPAGWSSELSSGWVSYSLWLQPHLQAGARSAVGVAATGPSGGPGPQGPRTGPQPVLTLEHLVEDLRSRHFVGQDRALDAVCTRVMLRTGVDLRAPRPEQAADPVLIAQVVKNLLLMGYAPGPAVTAAVSARGAAVAHHRAAAAVAVAGGPLPTDAAGGGAVPEVSAPGGAPRAGSAPGARPAPARRPWWSRLRRGG